MRRVQRRLCARSRSCDRPRCRCNVYAGRLFDSSHKLAALCCISVASGPGDMALALLAINPPCAVWLRRPTPSPRFGRAFKPAAEASKPSDTPPGRSRLWGCSFRPRPFHPPSPPPRPCCRLQLAPGHHPPGIAQYGQAVDMHQDIACEKETFRRGRGLSLAKLQGHSSFVSTAGTVQSSRPTFPASPMPSR